MSPIDSTEYRIINNKIHYKEHILERKVSDREITISSLDANMVSYQCPRCFGIIEVFPLDSSQTNIRTMNCDEALIKDIIE